MIRCFAGKGCASQKAGSSNGERTVGSRSGQPLGPPDQRAASWPGPRPRVCARPTHKRTTHITIRHPMTNDPNRRPSEGPDSRHHRHNGGPHPQLGGTRTAATDKPGSVIALNCRHIGLLGLVASGSHPTTTAYAVAGGCDDAVGSRSQKDPAARGWPWPLHRARPLSRWGPRGRLPARSPGMFLRAQMRRRGWRRNGEVAVAGGLRSTQRAASVFGECQLDG